MDQTMAKDSLSVFRHPRGFLIRFILITAALLAASMIATAEAGEPNPKWLTLAPGTPAILQNPFFDAPIFTCQEISVCHQHEVYYAKHRAYDISWVTEVGKRVVIERVEQYRKTGCPKSPCIRDWNVEVREQRGNWHRWVVSSQYLTPMIPPGTIVRAYNFGQSADLSPHSDAQEVKLILAGYTGWIWISPSEKMMVVGSYETGLRQLFKLRVISGSNVGKTVYMWQLQLQILNGCKCQPVFPIGEPFLKS